MSKRFVYSRGFVTAVFVVAGLPRLLSQESDLRPGTVKVKADTPFVAAPRAGAMQLKKLPAGSELRLLDSKPVNGYVRVLGPKGPVGWVKSGKVDVTAPVASAAAGAGVVESAAPCQSNLGSCPVSGCSPAGTPHALVNEQKRKTPDGSVTRLAMEDFGALQDQADSLVGQGQELTAADRASLSGLTVSSGSVGEGSKVQVTGFMAAGPLKPHANSGESVNCNLRTPTNNDFHISFVEAAGHTEFDGVVVEMTPQTRPAGWTLGKLDKLRAQKRMVMVTGGLFYDNLHAVNADQSNPMSGQPARFSLWEIHPITEFMVCAKAGNSCDPDTAGDWKTLENFQ